MTIITHIDMNSFFASCEQQANPALRGKVIGVCEHLGGIIIAPSIEAKRIGIKTAMPVWEARKIYPRIQLMKVNARLYFDISSRVHKVLSDYTDDIEEYSVDEFFLDLTESCNIRVKDGRRWTKLDPYVEAMRIILEIKQRIKKEVGDYLTASAGIAPNKLLAKISGEFKKPDGLTVIRPEDIPNLYNILALTDIPGISNAMERRLNRLGIRTLADLRDYPRSHLLQVFGIWGEHLHAFGQLRSMPFEKKYGEQKPKSIGHVYTLPAEFRQGKKFLEMFFKLCRMVAERMSNQGVRGNGLALHIHGNGDECYSFSSRYAQVEPNPQFIYRASINLLAQKTPQVLEESFIASRIGITVFDVFNDADQQYLFPKDRKNQSIMRAMEAIKSKHGDYKCAYMFDSLSKGIFRESVGFRRLS